MKLLHYIPYLAIFLCRGNVSFFLPLLHARIQRGPTQTMFFFSGVGGGGGGGGLGGKRIQIPLKSGHHQLTSEMPFIECCFGS